MQKDKLSFLRLPLALVGIKWLTYLNKTQCKEQVAGLFHHFLAEKEDVMSLECYTSYLAK